MVRGRSGSHRGVGDEPDDCASAGHAKNHQRNEQPKHQARERSAIQQLASTCRYCPPRDVDHQDDGRDRTQDRKNYANLHGSMIRSRLPIGKDFRAARPRRDPRWEDFRRTLGLPSKHRFDTPMIPSRAE